MTTHGLRSSNKELMYVMDGREALARRLPNVRFDDPAWDTKAIRERTAQLAPKLYLTVHGSQTEPLPVRYAAVVKAWMAQKVETPSRMSQRSFAARWLWRAIAERLGPDAPTRFAWADLQLADVHRTEQLMLTAELGQATINKAGVTLAEMMRDLAGVGIAPPIVFKPRTKRYRDSNNHRLDDPEARDEGVLSRAALNALADIFAHPLSRADEFFGAVFALMIATGVRFNEVTAIPLDALEDEQYNAPDVTGRLARRSRTYLRFYKTKSHRNAVAGAPSFERIPLSGQQVELARLAVERLTRLCAEAREVAAGLEAMNKRWRWSELVRPEYLSADDVARVLGCSRANADVILRQHGEVDPDSPPRAFPMRRIAMPLFEAYMTDRIRWDLLWVVAPAAGQPGLRASGALLCFRENELHGTRSTLPIIDTATHSAMERWLEGLDAMPSVFRRHELERGVTYTEADGSPVMINSHMCRRLFVTNAYTAGATTLDVMRWQGREHAGDLAAYDRRSMLERATAVKGAIKSGRLRGQVAQVYLQLADDVRDMWLEDQVRAMHVTPLGLCVHDFSVTPCPRALNCLKECPDYLHDPNDAGQRQQLVQLQRRTREVLEKMEPEVAAGRIASAWVDEHQRTLRNVDHILSMPASPDGAYVRPFGDAPTVFQPITPENDRASSPV